MIKVGLEKANKKRKSNGGYLGHVWTAVVGLARLLLAIFLLASVDSRFETIVVVMLVFIYVGIRSTSEGLSYRQMIMAFGIDNQFARVLRKIGREEIAWEREQRLEAERNAKREGARNIIRFNISGIFLGLIWLLAMIRLLAVLLAS